MSEESGVQAGQLVISASEWNSIANDAATRISISQPGYSAVTTSDGGVFSLLGAEPLVAPYRDRPWILFKHLETNRDDLTALSPSVPEPAVKGALEHIASRMRNGDSATKPDDRRDAPGSDIEGHEFSDTLFDPLARVSVPRIAWTMDPRMGTIVINPDGAFTFAPANGFSAEAADANSISATHTIVIEAVTDGPSFTAVAAGLEDTDIPFAITSSLVEEPADATDTSQSYDFIKLTLDPGVDFGTAAVLPSNIQLRSVNVLLDGRTEVTFAPGVGTTTAQFEDFLANGITVRPPIASDVNFDVDIEIGTIEASLTEAGGFSLERFSYTDSAEGEVTSVNDALSITATSSFNEDGIQNPALAPAAPGNAAPFVFGSDI